MMVGPVEHPRHRTVTAIRSSQLSLLFSALTGSSQRVATPRRSVLEEDIGE
jgi:hypothetical protein